MKKFKEMENLAIASVLMGSTTFAFCRGSGISTEPAFWWGVGSAAFVGFVWFVIVRLTEVERR